MDCENKRKQLSFCIPVYNTKPDYLYKLLDSLAKQTVTDFEVIIRDDRSKFDYSEIVKHFVPSLSISFRVNEANLGMVGNWNETVNEASGEYIVVAGHDDAFANTFVEEYLNAFRARSDISLVSCRCTFINEEGSQIIARHNINHRDNIFLTNGCYFLTETEAISLCLRNGNAIGELSALMFKKSDFINIGRFNKLYCHAADLALALSLLHNGNLIYINRPLVLRRLHSSNLTWQNLSKGIVSSDRELIFQEYRTRVLCSDVQLGDYYTYLWAAALYDIFRIRKHKSIEVARYSLKQIIRYWPPFRSISSKLREVISGVNLDSKWISDKQIGEKQ